VTPLATLTVSGSLLEDRFTEMPTRNVDSYVATANLQIGSEAALSGQITVGYRDVEPVDLAIKPAQDVTAEGGVTYRVLEIGRINFGFRRSFEYSVNPNEGYYLENTINLSYTHRLFGEVDAQVRGSKSLFTYNYSKITPYRQDTLGLAGASVGYNVRNRTRIALNYEFASRRSPVFPDRNYDRNRAFVSWGYAF
jgi:hypothetical protein